MPASTRIASGMEIEQAASACRAFAASETRTLAPSKIRRTIFLTTVESSTTRTCHIPAPCVYWAHKSDGVQTGLTRPDNEAVTSDRLTVFDCSGQLTSDPSYRVNTQIADIDRDAF